jgi:hypothetical protein
MKRATTRSVRAGLGVLALAASCGFPHLPEITGNGDMDAGGGDIDASDDDPTVRLELVAGNIGGAGNGDGFRFAARFTSPGGVAVDRARNVYVADTENQTIRKITSAGAVTTLAGSPVKIGSTDGSGAAARFNFPSDVTVDALGTVYVADIYNHVIRKITAAGGVTTLAGAAEQLGTADGPGAMARFAYPGGVTVDDVGFVYVADSGNDTIRKISPEGAVSTLAGMPGVPGSTDGTGMLARFDSPRDVAVDRAGNVFVAEAYRVRMVSPTGVVTTVVGAAGSGYSDGPRDVARFSNLSQIAVNASGTLYVTDESMIRRISPDGTVTTLAGAKDAYGSEDGTGSAARFQHAAGVAVDADSTIYVADSGNHTIRKIVISDVTTLAGMASPYASTDGEGTIARFASPWGVAADRSGNLYVADTQNQTIRKITAGVASVLAGSPGKFDVVDGTGGDARFFGPEGVSIDGTGNLYVADTGNETIRKITPDRVVTTVAGTARVSGADDGTGTRARFYGPSSVAIDGAGNLYIADKYNALIRKIGPDGAVTTLAGAAGMYGSVDGTGAEARFARPSGVAIDSTGNIYVADEDGSAIRKITAAGVVTTLAGVGGMKGSADGTGAEARFNYPSSVALDSAGNLYVADTFNATIRKITPTGVTTTITGMAGVRGILLGDAPRLSFPKSLAITGDSIVIADGDAILVLRHGAR